MASIKLARHVPEYELSMDQLVAEAVLEFGDDLRRFGDCREMDVRGGGQPRESKVAPAKNNERTRRRQSPPRLSLPQVSAPVGRERGHAQRDGTASSQPPT